MFYASGTDFPDGLSATPAAAGNSAPLLLSSKSCMPAATSTATKTLNPALRVFIGGTGVITTSTTACGNTAVAALNALPVKGRAPTTGYSRDQFGAAWSDSVTV